ncbi:hypothetical protein MRX96_050290 [Rhipicephalus microplus]
MMEEELVLLSGVSKTHLQSLQALGLTKGILLLASHHLEGNASRKTIVDRLFWQESTLQPPSSDFRRVPRGLLVLPADYESRMRLELRTQAPDDLLQEYVHAMEDFFSIAVRRASNEERVEWVVRSGTSDVFGASAWRSLA